MPSQHKHPAKAFRPPPDLYDRAKKAIAEVDSDMNAHLVGFLRWVAGDTDELPARPGQTHQAPPQDRSDCPTCKAALDPDGTCFVCR